MTQKTDNTVQTKQTAESAVPEHLRVDTTTSKVRTPGWKLFDLIVHGGINGVLNIAASVWMANDRKKHIVNKAIDGEVTGFTKGKDLSGAKKRNVTLGNLPLIGNFYEFSDWLDTQFYNKDAHGNIKNEAETAGKGFKDKYDSNQAKGGFFGRLEDGPLGNIPVIKQLLRPLGKYTGGVLFLAWGGHVTNAIMSIFESKSIKPKLVRFLDKVIDGSRAMFGKSRTAEELAGREEIYKKLDSDLAGKTMKGIWGARFAGILTVIVGASAAEAVDEAINGRFEDDGKTEKPLGILRASQGFFKAANFTKGGINYNRDIAGGKKKHWEPDFLSNNKTSLKAAESSYIADQTATEIMGTGITTATQYIWLMARELFGVGPKTNIGDKKDKNKADHSSNRAPIAQHKTDEPAPTKAEDTILANKPEEIYNDKGNKTPRYSDKNKPAGSTYQDKATAAQEVEAGQVI